MIGPVVLCSACGDRAEGPDGTVARPEEPAAGLVHQFGRSPYPPITEVPVSPATEADEILKPSELVLGVTVNGESRAYPINMLTGPSREILNDTLGGRPIAATWCFICHDAIVYAREVGDRVLTLGVSGMLDRGNMIMYDQETMSLWSQLLGEAKRGPLEGTVLEPIPSVLTDWETWKARHPDSTVASLSRKSTEYHRDFYENLDEFVLGIASEGEAKAWPFDVLEREPIVNDRWDGRPVLVTFDRRGVSARLFARTVDGRVLTFAQADGEPRDVETGSRWDPVTGRAIDGPLAGRALRPLPAFPSLRSAWLDFHEDSEFGPSASDDEEPGLAPSP